MGYLLFGVGLALVVALAIYLHQPPVPQRAAPQQRNEDEDEDEFEGTMGKRLRRNFTEQRTRRRLVMPSGDGDSRFLNLIVLFQPAGGQMRRLPGRNESWRHEVHEVRSCHGRDLLRGVSLHSQELPTMRQTY